MRTPPTAEPGRTPRAATSELAADLQARTHDIGALTVGRVLPAPAHRMVGPFIFFDHIGPARLAAGQGLDVRPHPHIGLATVTYLFDGEIVHRDSLGSHQPIRPGDVNWMTAGRGIVHSERSSAERRRTDTSVHGLQLWVALPVAHEQTAPQFHHHPAPTLPSVEIDAARVRVLAGELYGQRSPVQTFSPLFYADALLSPRGTLELPDTYGERAAYVVEGLLDTPDGPRGAGHMLVFTPGASIRLHSEGGARIALLGGEPIGTRYIEWNFVSSSRERIEQAKRDWREGRFPKVPGDEREFIPLPESD